MPSKAETTRSYLLQTSFQEMYETGYLSTSLDKILEKTNVTKGAFYYHFKNKEEMGLAVINEVIADNFRKNLIHPMKGIENDHLQIHAIIKKYLTKVTPRELKNGCPTNNLIQEMGPINTRFRKALLSILDEWTSEIERILIAAQEVGTVKKSVECAEAASFIVTSYEGARGLGKAHQTRVFYHSYTSQLKNYLESL